MTVSCCMREPMETAPSPGDDTHAAVTRPMWAREHGLRKVCGRVGGVRACPIDKYSKKGCGQTQTQNSNPLLVDDDEYVLPLVDM